MDAALLSSDTFVDINLLVPVQPNLMNRDDRNRPKSIVHGGVERNAVSSQFLKRSIRRLSINGKVIKRSRHLPYIVGERCGLVQDGVIIDEEKMIALASALYDKGKSELKGKDRKNAALGVTNGIILFSDHEVDVLVEVVQNQENTKKWKGSIKKALDSEEFRTLDRFLLSLYGRMSTNNSLLAMPDGALQTTWPYSTSPRKRLVDFFTATDDLDRHDHEGDEDSSSEGHGSAFMGTRQFNGGSTMLVQARIQIGLLFRNAEVPATEKNNRIAEDVIVDCLNSFLRPFSGAAGQGSFAVAPRAYYAMVRRGVGAMYDAGGAFLNPSKPGTLPSKDADRLESYMHRMGKVYQEVDESITFCVEHRSDAINNEGEFMEAVRDVVRRSLGE